MVDFTCPKCRIVTSVPDYLAGQKTVCPECQSVGLVFDPAITDLVSAHSRKTRERRRHKPVEEEQEVGIESPGVNVCGVMSLIFSTLAIVSLLSPTLFLVVQNQLAQGAAALSFIGAVLGLCGYGHQRKTTAVVGSILSTMTFIISLLALDQIQRLMGR